MTARKKVAWAHMDVLVPKDVAVCLERFAAATRLAPGQVALICLLQGFAMQLYSNGNVELFDACLEIACAVAGEAEGARLKVKDVEELAEELLR
jgi:hypothetical protein